MRILIIITSLFTIFSFSSKSFDSKINLTTEDTLRRYSYRFQGIGVSEGSDGSVFFYKNGHKLFLITANHVLCGCSFFNEVLQKDSIYPMHFESIRKEEDNSTFVLSLNTQSIRDTCKCMDLFERPDLIVVPIPDVEANKIWNKVYSVENFKMVDIVDGGEIKIVGYPSDSNYRNGRASILPLSGVLNWKLPDYKITLNHPINTVYESYVKTIPHDTLLSGYSGSPVFFREDEFKPWNIAGVFSGTINRSPKKIREMRVPKFRYAFDYIKKMEEAWKSNQPK